MCYTPLLLHSRDAFLELMSRLSLSLSRTADKSLLVVIFVLDKQKLLFAVIVDFSQHPFPFVFFFAIVRPLVSPCPQRSRLPLPSNANRAPFVAISILSFRIESKRVMEASDYCEYP